MTAKTVVAAALIAVAATGAGAPPNAMLAPPARIPVAPQDNPDPGLPTNPSDPRCVAMPEVAHCQGGPYAADAAPTGPADTACISQPANPVCAGGPYALPPPAPPIAPPPPAAAPPPVDQAPLAPPPVQPPPMEPPPMEAPPMAPPAMPVAPAAPADPDIAMPGHI